MAAFRTIEQSGCSDYTVTKSRFLGRCVHIDAEEDVAGILADIRKEYWDAKHHCWAYVLGEDAGRARYSDDGEPGGTAGLPILNAIRSNKLTDTLVIVTRYFGGVLLGTGGLVRAYGKAASDAIENAVIVTMQECCVFDVRVPYPAWPKLTGFFNENCLSVEPAYEDAVLVRGTVTENDYPDFCAKLIDRSDGKLSATLIETKRMPVKE